MIGHLAHTFAWIPGAGALTTALLAAAGVLLVLVGSWAAVTAWLSWKMGALEAAGDPGEAARVGERWLALWPLRSAGARRLAALYLSSTRDDAEAVAGLARAIPFVPDPAALARAVADRTDGAHATPHAGLVRGVLQRLREQRLATPRDLLRLARLVREGGDLAGAREILESLRRGPEEGKAILVLRDILLESGARDAQAEKILRESLVYDSDHPGTVLALYAILEGRWDTTEASAGLYEKALTQDPGLEWAHTALGEIHRNRGRTEAAIRHFLLAGKDKEAGELLRKRHGQHPRDPKALADLKEFFLERGRVDSEARAVYTRWKELNPGDPSFDAALLEVYLKKGYAGADALDLYEKAHALDPKNAPLGLLLSRCYREAGRLRDAVWVLEEIRDEAPEDPGALEALVRLYAEERVKTGRAVTECAEYVETRYDESVAAFLKDHFLTHDEPAATATRALEVWLRHHADDIEVVGRLARLYADGRNAERGIPALELLMAQGKSAPWMVRALAELHAHGGSSTPQAEEAYARAIAAGVATDPAILALAAIYAAKGRKDILASEIYHRAAAVEGCPGDVKVRLAEVYFDSEAFEDAASLAQEVLRVTPDHDEARRLEARALLKSGHVEGALDKLWKAHRQAPADFRTAGDLAEALAAQGDASREAASVYEAYLALGRQGAGTVSAETGWTVMRALGVARFLSGASDKGLSILRTLYGRDGSRPAGERLAGEVGPRLTELDALALGETLLELGDSTRARPLVVRGLKANPSAAGRVLERVRAFRLANPAEGGQAAEFCEALRAAVGDLPALQWEIVEVALSQGDVDDAAVRMRTLLGPGAGPDPALSRPFLEAMRDRWAAVVSGGREDPGVLYIQGRLRLALGEHEEALRWLKRAHALAPRDDFAMAALRRTYQALIAKKAGEDHKEKLADLFIESGELDEAIPVLQSVAEDYERRRDVIAKLAKCFIDKGHPLIASKNLERAMEEEDLNEENADMFYTLADAYELSGDVRKAKITFEKIGFWNYGYRDVRQRLDDLGRQVLPTPSTPVTPSPLSPTKERRTIGGLETAELPVGKVEGGRFEVLELRGRGGMAIVYKALDHEFDPPLLVALKVLPDEFAHREKAVRLLKREASAAIQLTHPGIVRIFSTGEEQGKRYISMEYIEGPDLATLADRKGRLPVPLVTNLLAQTLEALGYAHRQGVIHKDIKPSNIMLTEDTAAGRVKITDFGIARIVTDQIGFSRTLSVRGTLPYMSPQQIAGEPADAQSDIYSLGITFYEMLAGDPPFVRGDVAYQHTYKAATPLTDLNPEIPQGLNDVVMRCLEKKLAVRFKNTTDVLEALQAAL